MPAWKVYVIAQHNLTIEAAEQGKTQQTKLNWHQGILCWQVGFSLKVVKGLSSDKRASRQQNAWCYIRRARGARLPTRALAGRELSNFVVRAERLFINEEAIGKDREARGCRKEERVAPSYSVAIVVVDPSVSAEFRRVCAAFL